MSQSFSKIWVLIILIILIAGGIFAWQYFGVPYEKEVGVPEERVRVEEIIKEETADWKTYKDEGIGVEFSYPEDWYFISPRDWYVYFGEQEGKVLLGKQLAVSPYAGERAPLYKIFKIISANPLEKALRFLEKEYHPLYYTVELQEKFKFKGQQAQKVLITNIAEYYVERGIEAQKEIAIVILDDRTGFIISLPNRNPEYAYPFSEKESDIINQMLSTFRFLE